MGAAVVLGLQNKVSAVRLEEKIGLITALVRKDRQAFGRSAFRPAATAVARCRPDRHSGIAQALGLDVEDIGCDVYKPAVFSAGVTFHLVPVRDAEVLCGGSSPIRRMWNEVFSHDHNSAYVFTLTPEEPDNDLAARMFGMDVGEDPGTGSAAAALIGLLAEHAALATGQADFVLRQGHEMGRPCRITIQLRKDHDVLIHGGIGGHAVVVGEGRARPGRLDRLVGTTAGQKSAYCSMPGLHRATVCAFLHDKSRPHPCSAIAQKPLPSHRRRSATAS